MANPRRSSRPDPSSKPLRVNVKMMALEQRFVFDAALAGDLHHLADHTGDAAASDHAHHGVSGEALVAAARSLSPDQADTHGWAPDRSLLTLVAEHNRAPSNHQVAFIDGRVADIATLVKDIPEGTRIVLIDPSKDGVAQMVAALRGEDGITAVHILSHGNEAHVQLGSSVLDETSMSSLYRSALTSLHGNLAAGADILVYGCDFGRGADGARAVDLLASLTGANVAASINATGGAAGADWTLERQTGSIDTSAVAAADWNSELLTITAADGSVTTTKDVAVNGNVTSQISTDVPGTLVHYGLADVDGNLLPDGTVLATAHGTVTITDAATGAYTYTPNAGFHGTDSFIFGGSALDDQSNLVTGTAVETITINNTAIVAASESDAVIYQHSFSGTLTDNVTANPSGLPLTYTITSGPSHGSVLLNPDGTFTYTPDNGYSGPDGFHFQVDDGSSDPGSANVDFSVSPPPLVGWWYGTAVQTDHSVTLPISNQSSDAMLGAIVSFSVDPMHTPQHGSVTDNGDGTYTYTPDAGYAGTDSFQLLLTDQFGNSGVATTYIEATASGHTGSPNAGGDSYSIVADTSQHLGLSRWELPSNGIGETVTIQSVGTASHGTVSLVGGNYVYTPDVGYVGTDSISYTVVDQYGQTATGTEHINVYAPPLSTSGVVKFGAVGQAIDFNLDGQSSHSNSDPFVASHLTYTITANPQHGVLTVNASTGAVHYTPNPGYSGVDTFSYDVYDGFNHVQSTDTIVSPAHIFAGSKLTLVPAGTTVSGGTAAFSGTPNGSPAWSELAGPHVPGNSATYSSDGSYSYSSAGGFHGLDTVKYRIANGLGNTATNYLYFYTPSAVVPGDIAPTSTAIPDQLNHDSSSPSVDISGYFTNNNPPGSPALGYTAAGLPAGLSIDANTGVISGTIDHNASQDLVAGQYPVTIIADDGQGGITQQTFTWTVVNDDPAGTDHSYTGPYHTAVAGNASIGATDPNTGDALSYTQATSPAHGSVTFNSDGTYSYMPDVTFAGTDTFDYTVSDGKGGTATYTETITITPPAIAAVDDTYTTAFNTPLNGVAKAADTYAPGSTFAKTSNPSHGTVTFHSNGTYTYTPVSGFVGTDSFTYQVTDPVGQTASATETIKVAPGAVSEAYSTPFNTSVNGNASTADTFVPGSTFAKATNPAHGSVVFNPDGTYTYTPTAGYTGNDSFTYTVTDPITGASATATETIHVGPHAVDDGYSTPYITPVNGTSSTADSYAPGSTFAKTTNPSHGAVTFNSNGTYTYTPNAGFAGTDSFTYTVTDPNGLTSTATETITVTPPAIAAVNDAYTTGYVTPVNGNAALADTYAAGSTFTKTSNPSHGTVTFNSNGTYTYTPSAGFTGTDSFTYLVTDPVGQTATATETITVTAPAIAAINDAYTTGYVTPVNGAAGTADTYAAGSVFTRTSNPSHGSVTFNSDGTYTYTPSAGFAGTDSFTYLITDPIGQTATATETITVTPPGIAAVNDSYTTPYVTPVTGAAGTADTYAIGSTFAKTSNPSHGTVAFNPNGTYTYTPNAGFSGVDSFTYTVTDPVGQTATATETITVTPPALSAVNDTYNTAFDTPFNGAAATGDTYYPGSTFAKTTDPAHGTVMFNSDGSYTYTPHNGYFGPDSFTYTITDPTGHTSTATEIITVAVPGAPVAVNDSYTTAYVTPVNGAAATADSYSAGSTFAKTTNPAHGSVTFNSDGTYTYTPDADFAGVDSFTYTVTDLASQTSTATETITVTAPAIAAVDDAYTTAYVTPVNGSAPTADTYVPGSTFAKTTDPAHGSVTFNSDGSYTYTPNAGFAGTDTFTYTVTDPTGQTATATETITVTPPAIAAVDDSVSTPYGTPVGGDASSGDTFVGGSSLAKTTDPAHGTVTFNPDGTYTYTPDAGFTGTDTFTYTVTDPTGQTATATETIHIGPNAVDDAVSTSYTTAVNGASATGDAYAAGSTFAKTTDPAHGTVVFHADGTYTYTPAAGFAGTDTFTYTVTDPSGLTSTATETITVTPPAIAAVDDSTTTAYVTPVNGNAALADTYAVGSTFAKTTDPAHGTVTFNPDGTYTYTPAAGFAGTDTFTYTVTDPTGQTATATETIVVSAPALVAVNDAYTTKAGAAVAGNAAAGDTYAPGSTFAKTTDPAHGSVVFHPDGTFTYTPAAGFSGSDIFTYTVTDPTGHTVTATETITVTPPLKAVNHSYTGTQGTTMTGSAASRDTYPAGSVFSVATRPHHGTVVMNPNGTFTYKPNPAFSGTDTFTYTITDPAGNTVTGTETIRVSPSTVGKVFHHCLNTFTNLKGHLVHKKH